MAKKTVKRTAKKVSQPVETPKTWRMQKAISIPADLHHRLEEYPNENWSAVARQAFEIRLGELAKLKESKTMSDVVSRLRASKMAADSDVYKNGFKAGQKWARDYAEAPELQRIESLHTAHQWDWEEQFANVGDSNAWASCHGFHATVAGYDSPSRDEAEEFFDNMGASREEMFDGEYVRGFADGALNVWDEVKDQL